MNLSIYNNKSDKIVVNKNITLYDTIECSQWVNDVLNPIFILPYIQGAIRNYNYVYCDTFNRYYYINNYTVENGLLYLNCSIDVLMSYKDEILSSNQLVTRQENKRNKMLIDGNIPIRSDYSTKIIRFNKTPFNIQNTTSTSKNFLLVTLGGYGS